MSEQVANRAFVALAVQAGIIGVLRQYVGMAMDKDAIVTALRAHYAEGNPALALGINTGTLDAVLDYMERRGDPAVVDARRLPRLLDEDGPAVVQAERDGTDAGQVNVRYSEPPPGYTAELYIDGRFAKHARTRVNRANGLVNEFVPDVAAGAHTVQVLFRAPGGDLTRFGPGAAVEA